MFKLKVFHRLSVRLTAAFLFAATMGVALVAVFAYYSAASDFRAFLGHVEAMQGMMGGGMGGMIGGALAQAGIGFLSDLEQTLWIAGLLGIALALVLGGLFTRQIVAPLGEVAAAARHVAQGDLSQRVRIHGASELAELGESFNAMAATLGHDRELRQNMVADIAHELRTPLSVLQGNVEAMLDGVLEANAENLASLHQETLLLARLIEDLRTLSLAESGQLSFQIRATDLKALFSRVIEGLQAWFAAKHVKLAIEAPDNLASVQVDPDRTAQVMRNLLNNALHYTPEGGDITVRLIPDASGITTSVTDTGAGIPAEDLPRIFDRFYRVDRSRTRSTGGSDLGLAIVKQLVEAQGGHIWASSRAGKGSAFFFRFPGSSS